MALPNVFTKQIADQMISRISQLSSSSQPLWGKMNVAQMCAHCCVTYEYLFEEGKYTKPTGFKKFIIKALVKNTVVNEKPYKKNSQTAPDFKVSPEQDFQREKTRLIGYIQKVQEMGAQAFEGRESHSFGPLRSAEWNNMFYKHLDHHLSQFGV